MGGLELKLVQEAFASNWIAPLGPMVDAFEQEFSRLIGGRHAVALSSGTAALHLSMILLGIQAGDEVFCSTLTFSATANAIMYAGGVPVFIDSDKTSWNMDPDLLEEELLFRKKINKLPKAAIVVDLYGQCANYQRIESLCSAFGIPMVEDAAEALGADCSGKMAGNFGRAAIFSFNGNKIITTSGGGMLVSADEALIKKARFLATQARDPAPHYQHSSIGYNYRMSNILAAIGREQLKVLDDRVTRKREIFAYYWQAFGDLPGIEFMPEPAWSRSNRWLTVIQINPEEFGTDRETVRLALEVENIESRPVWKPMHLQPVFAHCQVVGGAVAADIFDKGLCLPSGTALTESDLKQIVSVIRGFRLNAKI
jgi:pyridoxal phosphate-dependent aminotransferase EpsN